MTMTEHEMTEQQRVVAFLDAAINRQAETFAIYRDTVEHRLMLKARGDGRRAVGLAQKMVGVAEDDFRWATADVERAVRAAMPGATEREINDRMQQV